MHSLQTKINDVLNSINSDNIANVYEKKVVNQWDGYINLASKLKPC